MLAAAVWLRSGLSLPDPWERHRVETPMFPDVAQ